MRPGWMTATEVSFLCHPSLMFGPTARTALTQSGGKAIGRNLVLQATRVYAVNYFSATYSRALHPSDSPPQRDGSSCPSRARKRAPKSMPASPASRAPEDEKTVFGENGSGRSAYGSGYSGSSPVIVPSFHVPDLYLLALAKTRFFLHFFPFFCSFFFLSKTWRKRKKT